MFINTSKNLQVAAVLSMATGALALPFVNTTMLMSSTTAHSNTTLPASTSAVMSSDAAYKTGLVTTIKVTNTTAKVNTLPTTIDSDNNKAAAYWGPAEGAQTAYGNGKCVYRNYFLWLNWEIRADSVEDISGLCGGLWDNLQSNPSCNSPSQTHCGREDDGSLVWRFNSAVGCKRASIYQAWNHATGGGSGIMCTGI